MYIGILTNEDKIAYFQKSNFFDLRVEFKIIIIIDVIGTEEAGKTLMTSSIDCLSSLSGFYMNVIML